MAGTPTANKLPIAEKSTAIFAGWLLLLLGYVLAVIPFLGFLIWIIGIIFSGSAVVLGVYGAAKGRPFAGVFLICAAVASFFIYLTVPVFVISLFAEKPSTL